MNLSACYVRYVCVCVYPEVRGPGVRERSGVFISHIIGWIFFTLG